MAKVLCESCNTNFIYDAVKDMTTCPVCGKPLWGNEEDTVTSAEENETTEDTAAEENEGVMYFEDVFLYENEPESNFVSTYCTNCGKFNNIEVKNLEEFVEGKHVVLKSDFIMKCLFCGSEHKPRKIIYKKKERNTPPLPHCPLCNSTQLRKIKTGSKLLSAATLGIFSPNNGKTFECMNCHYKF